MHTKLISNTGFYILLLLAFMLPISAFISYILAALLFLLWLLDALIFKEVFLADSRLFFPIVGFNSFLILSWIVARIYNAEFQLVYVGVFFLIYFVIPAFIANSEQRRMVLWTFVAGAILMSGLHLTRAWAASGEDIVRLHHLNQPLLTMILLAFAILIALYAESSNWNEKFFLGLITLPLVLVIIYSTEKAALVAMLFVVVLGGIIRDKTLFIPPILAAIIIFSGAFGVNYYFEKGFHFREFQDFLSKPITQIEINKTTIQNIDFYGSDIGENSNEPLRTGSFFFLDLLKDSGPLSLILFIWIISVRAHEAYFKNRRLAATEAHPYHLAVLLTIGVILFMNIYGSAYIYSPIILASWMIWGMSEI